MAFEENQGQVDARVKYLARGPGYVLYLTQAGAVLKLTASGDARAKDATSPLQMDLIGANRRAPIRAMEKLASQTNCFIGKDPGRWHRRLANYGRLHYDDVYPGIDLIYYGNGRQLEYDFIVNPGADPNDIVLRFQGTEKAELTSTGDLSLHHAQGSLTLKAPQVYQLLDGQRQALAAHYRLDEDQHIHFTIAAYDHARPLIIDPILVYASYLGGTGDDAAFDVAVDASGQAYLVGATNSVDFPLGVSQGSFITTGGFDIFIAKLSADGQSLIYTTFFGGSDFDTPSAIALDAAGQVYFTGNTQSTDLPVTPGAFQATYGGGFEDAFVAKLSADGATLIYASYLGGDREDFSEDIVVDDTGHAYLTGTTFSISTDQQPSAKHFPTTAGAFQTDPNLLLRNIYGPAFVTKLSADGTALLYSSLLGDGGGAAGNAIAVDALGSAYVVGTTDEGSFALPFTTTKILSADHPFISSDIFVVKYTPDGSALKYATIIGTQSHDIANDLVIDGGGRVHMIGRTSSALFPVTPNALYPNKIGSIWDDDAVYLRLAPNGQSIEYATYLGGEGQDDFRNIALGGAGDIYISGATQSPNIVTTADAFQSTMLGTGGGYLAKLSADGMTLLSSTYLTTCNGLTDISGMAMDPAGGLYLSGLTMAPDFPVVNALQPNFMAGQTDGFVAKVLDGVPSGPGPFNQTPVANAGSDQTVGITDFNLLTAAVTLDGSASSDPDGDVLNYTWSGPFGTVNGVNPTVNLGLGAYTITLTVDDGHCHSATDSVVITVTDTPPETDLALNVTATPEPIKLGQELSSTYTITNQGPVMALGVNLIDTLPPGVTFVSALASQGICAEAEGMVSCDLLDMPAGATATVTIVIIPTVAGSLTNQATIAAQTADPDLTNNTTSLISTVIPPTADLALSIRHKNSVVTGSVLTYSLNVTNLGPDKATGVVLTDTLPSGVTFVSAGGGSAACTASAGTVTCQLVDLLPGATTRLQISVTPDRPGVLSNTATVTANSDDPVPTNNVAQVSTTVLTNLADLAVTITDRPDPDIGGGPVFYTIHTTNQGPVAAVNSRLNLTVSSSRRLSFSISVTTSQGRCTVITNTVDCNLATIANGQSVLVTLIVAPTGSFGNLVVRADVGADTPDPDTTNNLILEGTRIGRMGNVTFPADLSITAATPYMDQQSLVYELTIKNHGPGGATQVHMTDVLPSSVDFVSVTSSSGTQACRFTTMIANPPRAGAPPPQGTPGKYVVCDFSAIGVGGTRVITIRVRPTQQGLLANTASVSSAAPADPDDSNNSSMTSYQVMWEADLAITMSSDPVVGVVNQAMRYIVEVTNQGPSHASQVVADVSLPPQTSYVAVAASQGNGCQPQYDAGNTYVVSVQCRLGQLYVLDQALIYLDVLPTISGTASNTAHVSGQTTDPKQTNNSVTVQTAIGTNQPPHIAVMTDQIICGTTGRVSVRSVTGAQANNASVLPSISADGRFIAFHSWATNLLNGSRDTNNAVDVFVRDRLTGTTERVSVDSQGGQGAAKSKRPSISGDGRYVAFQSLSPFDVTDVNDTWDIYVRDRLQHTTELISKTPNGSGGVDASLSADGRLVAFTSLAPLTVDDVDATIDVYVYDRWTRQTRRISVTPLGSGGDNPVISADGRFVAFQSQAGLTADDVNGGSDIYIHDLSQGLIERVSVATDGAAGEGGVRPAISANGQVIAFDTMAALVQADSNQHRDVYVHDRRKGITERVSVRSNGERQGNGDSLRPSLSGDGQLVAFESDANTLVRGDTNRQRDIFVYHRPSKTTQRVNVNNQGKQTLPGYNRFIRRFNLPRPSQRVAMSGDGRFIAFDSLASNLARDTNNTWDVFVHGPLGNAYEGDVLHFSGTITDRDSTQWQGTVDYGDGSLSEAVMVDNNAQTFTFNHAYADNGRYILTVTIADLEGGSSTVTTDALVLNARPLVDIGTDTTVDEGAAFFRLGTLTDPGLNDGPYTGEVDYGDPNDTAVWEPLQINSTSFTLNHTYIDNGLYKLRVRILDKDGGIGRASLNITVKDVPPVVNLGPDAVLNEGDTLIRIATFTDPGILDAPWSAWVAYNDPFSLQRSKFFPTPIVNQSFSINHLYKENGSFLLTAMVFDKDMNTAMNLPTMKVTVMNVAPTINRTRQRIKKGTRLDFMGWFSDPGVLDTHSAVIAWGDGSKTTNALMRQTQGGGVASGKHSYTQPGTFNAVMTIIDDDGGTTRTTATVSCVKRGQGLRCRL